ncbi:MAG: pyridoxamine 5'-phosphate oxidase family protein [Thermodesulfobacteriota bacterium]|nr:pyridoxamine 5'-phosphate oxidase family protein [Thermodesulfobacteriota bacterium]
MNLTDYFEKVKGYGVFATADSEGTVNVAALSRPTVMDDGTVAFIMSSHLTHHNLQSNPHAAYYFVEKGGNFGGKRLYLTKVKEEEGSELIETLRKKRYPIFTTKYDNESRYVVFFTVDKILPLVADGVLKPGATVEY